MGELRHAAIVRLDTLDTMDGWTETYTCGIDKTRYSNAFTREDDMMQQ